MTAADQVHRSFTEHKKDLFGRRMGAMMIDYVLLAGVLLAADGLLGNDVYQKTLWIWLPVCGLYFPVLEGRYGATLGKKLMAVRVVGLDLSPCGYRRAIIRFLARLIDANPLVPILALIGYVSFQRTPLRQRWGDLAAKTLVVRTEDLTVRIWPSAPAPGPSAAGP